MAIADPGQFETLVNIIARLRAPDGCPWDRKQTHRSLREFLLEETYEVLEALDEGDAKKLAGEMGDLLLQIVLHAQIASEQGEFTLRDVMEGINTKLVRRHPHVFGTVEAKTAEDVVHNWEAIKKGERAETQSVLQSVPKSMPALAYSQEIQRRVAQVGFDWAEDSGVVDKLCEEINEFHKAETPEHKAEEFGDILFTLANIARRDKVDLEATLREANMKFVRRFTRMEEICRERGVSIGDLSFDEQNALWNEAKRQTK